MESHRHDHTGHAHDPRATSNIRAAFFLNIFFALIEIVGGFYTNSIAIISNALHDLGDSIGIGVSWYMALVSGREKTSVFSYGYKRFTLLAALVNGLVLSTGSFVILYHAISRIVNPAPANAKGMLAFAIAGVLVNGAAAFRLKGGATMNEQVVMLHLLEDVLGWAAVLIVSIVILWTDVPRLDPVLAAVVAVYILFNALRSLKKIMVIFLQGVPETVDLREMKRRVLRITGVKAVHDLHIWTLDGDHHIVTLHAILERPFTQLETLKIKNSIRTITENFAIHHATIELEVGEQDCFLKK